MTRLILIALLMAIAASCAREESEAPAGPRAELLIQRFSGIERLAVARMSIKKTASVDDIKMDEAQGTRQIVAALTDALKIGDRKGVYSYDTYLDAYIDLRDLTAEDINVDATAGKIRVSLPEIQTELSGRESGFHEEHYRVTGLRSAIGPAERAKLKEQMNTLLKEEVKSNEEFTRLVTETGRQRAETFFKEMLGSDGYEVEINWK